MLSLPAELRNLYGPASADDVRSWSYGRIESRRRFDLDDGPERWRLVRRTLDDPSIFGPTHDFECACRKYVGQKYDGIICHVCGTLVGPRSSRAQRGAHIHLNSPIPHPIFAQAELDDVPVLPADYWESAAGRPLAAVYEQILDADGREDVRAVAGHLNHACELLLPGPIFTREWGLREATTQFAHGMALIEY
jgi:hypothetical protein